MASTALPASYPAAYTAVDLEKGGLDEEHVDAAERLVRLGFIR